MNGKVKLNAEDKIIRVRSRLIVAHPFFAQLLLALNVREAEEDELRVPTMGTDGSTLCYNREFVDSLDEPQLTFVMVHEAMHCALGHVWRRENRDRAVWNVAADYAVNSIITEMAKDDQKKVKIEVLKGALVDPQYSDMTAEEIYSRLMKNAKKVSISALDGDGDEHPEDDNGKSKRKKGEDVRDKDGFRRVFGTGSTRIKAPVNHEAWGREERKGPDHCQRMRTEWNAKLIQAVDAARAAGNLPGGLERHVGELRRPQRNWRQLLQDFIEKVVIDFGWTPPEHRYDAVDGDFLMPGFTEETAMVKNLIVAVDSSGSMDDQSIVTCLSEVNGAIEQFNRNSLYGTLLWWDTEVAKETFKLEEVAADFSRVTAYGGGGTDPTCVFEWARENRDPGEVSAIIILTDGYYKDPKPEVTDGFRVLWVYTDRNRRPPEGHESVFIEVNGDED